jgi:hypothetical protein
MPNAPKPEPNGITPRGERLHKATFATDKRNPGGYLVRVAGPTAAAFAGRDVPVTRKDDSESVEHLETCIWAGIDDESGKPVALYRFTPRPRADEPEDMPF